MIEPKILKGFRDILPTNMIAKKDIIKKLEYIFESFGFVPIDTPALEYSEVLLGKGGGETDKQMYRFIDHGKRDVALRFDLTVPLARYIARNYNKLIFPFKRYHIAPVWRGENTQKGRYREFYQCDFDILGSDSVNSDIEILLLIKEGLDKIGAGKFEININNRKILNALLDKLNIADKAVPILRTVDKIYKIGREKVLKELTDFVRLDDVIAEEVLDFLNLSSDNKNVFLSGDNIFKELEKIKSNLGNKYSKNVDELEYIFKSLQQMNILDNFVFNPAITRGLDYYTGTVFETFIIDRREFGSICSGGRYDNLTSLYSKMGVTGIGASFGLDRLLSLMEDKELLEKKATTTDLLIFNLDENLYAAYQNLASSFRNKGINTEVYLTTKKISAQFKFAERKKIKYALIAGETEIKMNKYNLKNIQTREEFKELTINQIYEKISKGN